MMQSFLNNRGQITIPAVIRKKLQLKPGMKLDFILDGEKIVIFPINKSIDDLRGLLGNFNNSNNEGEQ